MPSPPIDRRVPFTRMIVLFGILLALLVPSVGGRGEPRGVTATAEMRQLQVAISAFQAKFGFPPPSQMVLHEQPGKHPYDLEGSDPQALSEQSTVSSFRKLWPEFPILTGDLEEPGDGTREEDWIDFNGNGQVDDVLFLNGSECLVFFLGGLFRDGDVIGFDGNPRNPFGDGHPRVGRLFEFDPNRLIDHDRDGFPEYLDPLPRQRMAYKFISWGDGRGYRLYPPPKPSPDD